MKVLRLPNRTVVRTLGRQTKEDGIRYRLSRFVVSDGEARYNTLTGEALYQADEITLIERWFMVPEDMDETSLAYLIRQRNLRNSEGPGTNVKAKFVILTTTLCNAACVYCYEKGINSMIMSQKTAEDVANYIVANSSREQEIRIRWFGGDPLMNIPAINTITGILLERHVRFTSEVFTNGDRLNEVSDEILTDRWNLDYVQLTVDDVGEAYERIKGLPAGAFGRLLDTVKRLTSLGIGVKLRVHYHPGEGQEAPRRVIDVFRDMKGVTIYAAMLYDGGDDTDYAGLLEIQDEIQKTGKWNYPFPPVRYGASCMAENRKVACITPDGHLSPCEHYAYGENYGSIYEEGYNKSVLKRWKAKSRNYCGRCVLYPSCGKPAQCPAEGKCSPAEIRYKVERIKKAMRNGYAALQRKEY